MLSGFSLLEVLIALFILTFSLLTLSFTEISVFRSATDTYFTSLGQVQDVNMAECMKVSSSSDCLLPWNTENAKLIPDANGSVKKLTSSNKISLCWQAHFSNDKNCVSLSI